ncbi:MAG: acyltransferase [Lachnospiraceae bacterium]|nr:acyltransferase [Lachnospiraceae bacterium]
MTELKKRENWVDYLKAVACMSVVMFHVIYGLQNAGLQCSPFFLMIKRICGTFQIPIFMFASGYLYGKGSMLEDIHKYPKFLFRKLINLGVPYVIFSGVYYGVNVSMSHSVNFTYTISDLLHIYDTPLAQYWYLFALLLLFIAVPLFEWVFANEWLILSVFLAWKVINMFWISKTNYDYYFAQYAMYFYMGTIYSRHHEEIAFGKQKQRSIYLPWVLSLCLLFSIEFYNWEESMQAYALIEVLCACLGIYSLVGVFERYETKIGRKWLQAIAKYSFPIYLLHTIFTAAIRIALKKVGIVWDVAQVSVGFVLGLAITWGIAWVMDQLRFPMIAFYPEKTIKQWRNKN